MNIFKKNLNDGLLKRISNRIIHQYELSIHHEKTRMKKELMGISGGLFVFLLVGNFFLWHE